MADMDVDTPVKSEEVKSEEVPTQLTKGKDKKPRFEVKKVSS